MSQKCIRSIETGIIMRPSLLQDKPHQMGTGKFSNQAQAFLFIQQ